MIGMMKERRWIEVRVNNQYLKEVRASCTRHLFLYSLPDREELSIITINK
jgi:hypothetical protein